MLECGNIKDWLSSLSFYSLPFILSISFGPSGVCALPLAAGINEGGYYFGPNGVRALALAAGINKGGHYWSERREREGTFILHQEI